MFLITFWYHFSEVEIMFKLLIIFIRFKLFKLWEFSCCFVCSFKLNSVTMSGDNCSSMALTAETVRDYILRKGGKVTNTELVKHFKPLLVHPESKGLYSTYSCNGKYTLLFVFLVWTFSNITLFLTRFDNMYSFLFSLIVL